MLFLEIKTTTTFAFWQNLTTYNSCAMKAEKSSKKCATAGYVQSFCYAD